MRKRERRRRHEVDVIVKRCGCSIIRWSTRGWLASWRLVCKLKGHWDGGESEEEKRARRRRRGEEEEEEHSLSEGERRWILSTLNRGRWIALRRVKWPLVNGLLTKKVHLHRVHRDLSDADTDAAWREGEERRVRRVERVRKRRIANHTRMQWWKCATIVIYPVAGVSSVR